MSRSKDERHDMAVDPSGQYRCKDDGTCQWCGGTHFGSNVCPYSPAYKDIKWPADSQTVATSERDECIHANEHNSDDADRDRDRVAAQPPQDGRIVFRRAICSVCKSELTSNVMEGCWEHFSKTGCKFDGKGACYTNCCGHCDTTMVELLPREIPPERRKSDRRMASASTPPQPLAEIVRELQEMAVYIQSKGMGNFPQKLAAMARKIKSGFCKAKLESLATTELEPDRVNTSIEPPAGLGRVTDSMTSGLGQSSRPSAPATPTASQNWRPPAIKHEPASDEEIRMRDPISTAQAPADVFYMELLSKMQRAISDAQGEYSDKIIHLDSRLGHEILIPILKSAPLLLRAWQPSPSCTTCGAITEPMRQHYRCPKCGNETGPSREDVIEEPNEQ